MNKLRLTTQARPEGAPLQIVRVNAAGDALEFAPESAGSSTIEDEGTSLGTAGTLNFTGSGVTASVSGGVATVNVPGGAATVATAKVGRQVSTQPIPNATWTTVIWDTALWDTDSMVNLTASPTVVTIVTGGKYRLTAQVAIAANSSGYRQLAIRVNGTTHGYDLRPGVAGPVNSMYATVEVDLAAGDTIDVQVFQGSGGALTIGSSSSTDPRTFLSVTAI